MLSELLARREGCVGCLVGGESLNGLSNRSLSALADIKRDKLEKVG
jgi:hypothetical protein